MSYDLISSRDMSKIDENDILWQKIAVCYRVIMTQNLRHNRHHVVSQNLMTVVASI